MSDKRYQTYVEPLTDREMEVLQYLADNLSNKEIANQLVVEVSTVKWHNAQLYSKLQVNNRHQAVIRAQTLGILKVDPTPATYRLRHNLPADTIPFVGREGEIAQLTQQLIDDNVRLITIQGPGGMGKSRLAIEVGQRLLVHFRDGVYFVPLATVSSTEELLAAIAEAIVYQFFSETKPRQQLLQHLQSQHLLLIIDNFEHLLGHSKLLTDILKIAPRVKILVTTREKLNLGGEVVHVIDGLSIPADGDRDISVSDAVRLFMETAHRTTTQISQDDLNDVAIICKMLGGMPLAILLATAWLDTLTLEDVKAELDAGLAILETNFRDMPVRHQSISAVFDYSYRRLAPHEQDAFIQLTVFRGGFTREAAQVVASADIYDLQRLVHTSFIQQHPDGRYAIHELMRQYGEATLAESGWFDDVREKHAQFFADFVEPLNSAVVGMTSHNTFKRVNAEFNNIRHAWKFYAAKNDVDALRHFLDAVWLFCHEQDRSQEAIDLFEPILSSLQDQDHDVTLFRGQLLARIAWFHLDDQRQKAHELIEKSLQIFQMLDAPNDSLLIYYMQIMVMRFMNRLHESLEFAEKGYALAEETMNPKWLVNFRTQLAFCHNYLGNYEASERWAEPLPDYTRKALIRAANLIGMGRYAEAEDLLLNQRNAKVYLRGFNLRLYVLLTQCFFHTNRHSEAWHSVQHGLQYVNDRAYAWAALVMLGSALPLLIHEAEYQSATELISLIANHPSGSEFGRASALEHRAMLESKLTDEEFAAAWERGKHLDLGEVITDYMER